MRKKFQTSLKRARRQARLHELLRQGRRGRVEEIPGAQRQRRRQRHRLHGYFDIGIAVGSPRGLVVPIVRNADQMSFADIEKKIAEYGKKAGEGKLGIEELTGARSRSPTAACSARCSAPRSSTAAKRNPRRSRDKDRAVVENGQIVVRPINYLAMSYDHRIIDGREAVLGLVAMKEALEDPARLLFDI